MLKVWTYQSRSQIEEQLLKTDFEKNTWILSDLRSKLEIQNQLFDRFGFSLDEFVMRASDLWRALLRKSNPTFEIISRDFAWLETKNFLTDISNKDPIFKGLSENNWLDQLTRWSSVVFSPDLKDQVSSYLKKNSTAQNTWGREFLLAGLLANYFLEKKKLMTAWLPGFLGSDEKLTQVWDRALWVDLRGELSQSEAELFRTLSRNQEVNILAPDSTFEKDYFGILKPYEYLLAQAKDRKKLPEPELSEKEKNKSVVQFSGPLGEVKWAVGQVRSWLEEGYSAQSIAIVAPDIEAYWPCLQSYLQYEGVPNQKSVVSRLSTFPVVRIWFARIRASLNQLDFFSHEKDMYGVGESIDVRYEEFRSALFELYQPEDLNRIETLWEKIKSQPKWPDLLTRDEFLSRITLYWPQQTQPIAKEVLRGVEKFISEASSVSQFTPQGWFDFLEKIFSRHEVVIKEKNDTGIVLASLMSSWSHQLKKVIFLGIAEENLKSFSKFGLSPIDSAQLSADLGIVIDSVEQNLHEYELRWWMNRPSSDLYFLEPATDWTGQLLNHSALFIQEPKSLPSQHKSRLTRLDFIQAASLNVSVKSEQSRQRILEDFGSKAIGHLNLRTLDRLSPSAVESYLKCPFVFLANRVFKLVDQADIDIDIDRLMSGQFYHGFVEQLTRKFPDFRFSDEELTEIVEELRIKYLKIRSRDPTWIPRRNRFVKWGRHFLQSETNWAQAHPENRILATEVPWSIQVGPIEMRGQIDRIDGNEDLGQWLVIDYKSSASSISSVNSWIEDGRLQMLFYLWALENNAVSEIHGEGVGAFYYNLKNFDRKKGLRKEVMTKLLPEVKSKAGLLSDDKYKSLMEQFNLEIEKVINHIKQGQFQPLPRDEKDCPNCKWNKICRAPHLNQN